MTPASAEGLRFWPAKRSGQGEDFHFQENFWKAAGDIAKLYPVSAILYEMWDDWAGGSIWKLR